MQLFYTKWIFIFNIYCTFTIMGPLTIFNFMPNQIFHIDLHDVLPPTFDFAKPHFKCCLPIFWINKIFEFTNLKFTSTENKISWSDFIAETFSNLCNTKWQTTTSCI